MKRLITLSAFAAISSTMFMQASAQACDGQEGKRGHLESLDTNADGKVTQQEMLAAATARFNAADANQDGRVTTEERDAARSAHMQERLTAMDANKNGSIEKSEARGPLSHFFAQVDSDGNGALSPAEMAAHRQAHGKGHRRMNDDDDDDEPTTKADVTAKVTEHFKRLDANGDGVLTGEELQHGHGKHHGEGHRRG